MVTAKITNPSFETYDTKVIVHERLGELEQKLSTLTNSPQPKTKKAQEKRQAEILEITRSIDNFKAYLSLSIEQKVTDGSQLGIITDLTLSPGGLPEVWVSWYNHVPIPEQPIRLKPEPFFNQLKVGDSVTINDQHPEAAQQTFEVKEFRGEGWILTTTNQLFHHDFIEKIPNLEEETVSEMVKKFSEKSEIIDEKQPEQSTTIVEVVESSNLTDPGELTDEEARDRLHLERKVERAFYEAGKALLELRQRKLFRSTHSTFDDYVRERFGMQRAHSYRLMDAAVIVKNLEEKCLPLGDIPSNSIDSSQMSPIGRQILPTNERQVRPLSKLNPDEQAEAWNEAVSQVGGKVPPARVVKNIVDQIRLGNPVPNPWRKGEVAMIMVKDNPDLRGKGGCWCVITTVHDFSCTVRLWDGNYQVKPENLKELTYSNEQQEEVRKLCDRLSKLYDPEMEETAKAVLASLGRIDRPWLTEFEEGLLQFLEGNLKEKLANLEL